MSISYLTESEAPRDFRVSSTESDGHYKKCILCYTVKRNFYCAECVKNGNFVHSSMPYSDRFADKQVKLMRLKINRQHILDRCEKLLASKLKKDVLLTETKQSKDKVDLLRLAIEQRKGTIENKKKELARLKHYNSELKLKLPRYQKRVSSLGTHAQSQRLGLQQKIGFYNDQIQALAALRRSRIRQLTRYIFPVYISYDSSDSIEDMEFLGEEEVEEPPRRPQLHIVAPWIHTDGDCSDVQAWVSGNKECGSGGGGSGGGGGGGGCAAVGGGAAGRAAAALALAAQLLALLAWTLDVRLPYPVSLSEYGDWRTWRSGVRRVRAGCAALCASAGVPPPTLAGRGGVREGEGEVAPLAGLYALAVAAAADEPMLGRAEAWCDTWWGAWADAAECEADEPEPPEHLSWPDSAEMEELSSSPAAPAPSLVTSAAASLASMWRGWTK